MGTGPMTTSTGYWQVPTNPDKRTATHAVNDGHPSCGTWINYRILDWHYVGHGALLEAITCAACYDFWVLRLAAGLIAKQEGVSAGIGIAAAKALKNRGLLATLPADRVSVGI